MKLFNKFKKKRMKYKCGDKVRFKGSCEGLPHSHNTAVYRGEEVSISSVMSNGTIGCGPVQYLIDRNYECYCISIGWVYEHELESFECTKESISKEIDRLQCEIDLMSEKLDYLNKTSKEIFCEKEYKIYRVMELMNLDSSKTKALINILNDKCC